MAQRDAYTIKIGDTVQVFAGRGYIDGEVVTIGPKLVHIRLDKWRVEKYYRDGQNGRNGYGRFRTLAQAEELKLRQEALDRLHVYGVDVSWQRHGEWTADQIRLLAAYVVHLFAPEETKTDG